MIVLIVCFLVGSRGCCGCWVVVVLVMFCVVFSSRLFFCVGWY